MRTRALIATAVPVCLAVTPALALANPSQASHQHAPPDPAAAVTLFTTHLPPLATIGGVQLSGGAYGSSFTPAPGSDRIFYGLTDRGPNVDAPDGSKVEPLPDFQPAIGEFVLSNDGRARFVRRIGLSAADGTPYNGQVNPDNNTTETITDLDGTCCRPASRATTPRAWS